jgi:hypothetical protein
VRHPLVANKNRISPAPKFCQGAEEKIFVDVESSYMTYRIVPECMTKRLHNTV